MAILSIKCFLMLLLVCGIFVGGMECGARRINAERYRKTEALLNAVRQPSDIAAQEIQMIVGSGRVTNLDDTDTVDIVKTDALVQESALTAMRDLVKKYEKQEGPGTF